METGITRRSETRLSDTVTADSPYSRRDTVAVETGREPLGVPARFRVLSELGYGGMGVVYKVRDLETDEIVALKLLKPEVSSNPKMREELRQEVCLARKVTHKNVCRIHELYRSATASCISMEFIGGETLLARLRRDGALPATDAIAIARQTCAGLREAHAHGIVHRDLKPANIMINGAGVVKIMDFGIARRAQENDHSTTTIAGTPEYMAPEQIELRAMGPRTDIYALGLLLYEMVTGTRAFTGESTIAVAIKQLREAPKRPSEIVSSIPLGLEAVILKCLRKNADSRFQSVDELDAALSKPATAKSTVVAIVSPAIRVDAVLKSASSKWQELRPHVNRFTGEVHQGARRLGLFAEIEFKKLVLKAVAITPKAVRVKITARRAAVAAVVLPGIALFAAVVGNFDKRDAAISPSASSPSAQTLPNSDSSLSSVAALPTIPDAAANTSTPAETATMSEPGGADTIVPVSEDSVSDSPATSSPAETLSQLDLPAPARKKLTAGTTWAPRPAQIKLADAKNQAVAKTTVRSSAAVRATPVLAEPALVAAPATLQPVTPAADSSSNASKPDAISITYLEVGSFKETKWADDAVERLTQLGFHAICVHKTMLWKLQSYHVQVGPYTTPDEVEAAQEKLTAQGFKPHAVK